jgi:hypothetical protein
MPGRAVHSSDAIFLGLIFYFNEIQKDLVENQEINLSSSAERHSQWSVGQSDQARPLSID